MISAQDYFYDRNLTAFMQGHLGASAVTNDVNQTTADGRGSLFGGMGPYSLSFPYSNYTDTVLPGPTAEPSFDGSQGVAGIDKDAGIYRTAYFGFGVETLPNAADREAVLSRFLGWCTELAELDGDADGTDNGTDCAPGDPGNWASPSAARDLFLTTASTDNVSWLAPGSPGGDSVSYDLLRADNPSAFAGSDLPGVGRQRHDRQRCPRPRIGERVLLPDPRPERLRREPGGRRASQIRFDLPLSLPGDRGTRT